MLRPSIYSWFSAYRAASLESDFTLVPGRVREALQVIHDRLNGPARLDEQERQAIATARTGLGKLNAETVSEWEGRTTDDLMAASNACSPQTAKLMNITAARILDFRLSHFDIEIRMRSKDGKTTTFPSLTPPAPDLAQVVSDAVEYKIGHEEWITREQFELRLNDEN